jgi:hypothetical protein
MKYNIELLIDKPRSEIWQAFNDPEKLKIWQPSLSAIEVINGTQGKSGAESMLTFEENGRVYSLVERITFCQEPESVHQLYDNQFAINTVKNSFIVQGQNQTLWATETDYNFKTVLMKIMGPFYKKNFATRTERGMQLFKEMVESA